MKKLLFALVALLSTSPLAFASTPPDVFRGTDGRIYIHGQSSISNPPVIVSTTPPSRRIRAGSCGELTINRTQSLPQLGAEFRVVGVDTFDWVEPFQNLDSMPRCVNGQMVPAFDSKAFGLREGSELTRVVLLGEGNPFTPGISYPVEMSNIETTRRPRPNACGFYRVSSTDRFPVSYVSIGSTRIQVAGLPVAAPPICVRRSGQPYHYIPVSW